MANSGEAKPLPRLLNLSNVPDHSGNNSMKKHSPARKTEELMSDVHKKVQPLKSISTGNANSVSGAVLDYRVQSARKHFKKVLKQSRALSQSNVVLSKRANKVFKTPASVRNDAKDKNAGVCPQEGAKGVTHIASIESQDIRNTNFCEIVMSSDTEELGDNSKFPTDAPKIDGKFSAGRDTTDLDDKLIPTGNPVVTNNANICQSLFKNNSGLCVRTSVVESNCEASSRTILLKIDELPRRQVLRRSYKTFGSTKLFQKELICYRCDYCPQMTLKKEMMDLHRQRGGVCADKLSMVKCPGCPNVFATQKGLRAHMQFDHNMIPKDVTFILCNLHRVKLDQDQLSSSCAYGTGESVVEGYSPENIELTLQPEQNEELTDLSQERSSCAKRPTLLESLLDGISGKSDSEGPQRLPESGPDLLENTFNFTTPVSEQLPSIQAEHPPGAADVDTALMEGTNQIGLTDSQLLENATQEHVVVEGQYMMNHSEPSGGQCLDPSVNGQNALNSVSEHILSAEQPRDPTFLAIANVFSQHPDVIDQNRFKNGNGNEYLCISPGIPVIHLDDKPGEEFDLSSYANEPPTPPVANNHQSKGKSSSRAIQVPGDNEMSEEKKAEIKKLGCGFRCNINGCKFRMQNEENIKYHRRCHEGKLYNCPECCKDCPTWISLSSHLWQAHQIDMELYKCDLCSYRTPSYSRLTGIHRGIHGTARPFLCDDCGKGFKTVKQMRNHKAIHKAKMVRISCCFCSICGRTVADKRMLTQHVNSCHDKKKPFLCSICGYATGYKYSLHSHMRKHTGEKPYACDKCDHKAADHNAMRRHKMKHSGARNYKCSHCTYSCIQASTYKNHIKANHPSVESELLFSCSQCNFQSLRRANYLTHMADHRQNKFRETPFFPAPVELGPIMSERVVETIVDLSGAQTLLPDGYYDVEDMNS